MGFGSVDGGREFRHHSGNWCAGSVGLSCGCRQFEGDVKTACVLAKSAKSAQTGANGTVDLERPMHL